MCPGRFVRCYLCSCRAIACVHSIAHTMPMPSLSSPGLAFGTRSTAGYRSGVYAAKLRRRHPHLQVRVAGRRRRHELSTHTVFTRRVSRYDTNTVTRNPNPNVLQVYNMRGSILAWVGHRARAPLSAPRVLTACFDSCAPAAPPDT